MVSSYDYLNIGFYLLFIVGVSIYFLRRSKNTSDYFRGGGILPWWMTGAMAWMSSFSAWTFTGAAGKIYQTGPYVLVLYYASVPPLLILLSTPASGSGACASSRPSRRCGCVSDRARNSSSRGCDCLSCCSLPESD